MAWYVQLVEDNLVTSTDILCSSLLPPPTACLMLLRCCTSDNVASPATCKAAGAACCAGVEYVYTSQEMDDGIMQTETDTINDVWCMPSTCTAAFNPAATGRR